jgi:hypothetical protein
MYASIGFERLSGLNCKTSNVISNVIMMSPKTENRVEIFGMDLSANNHIKWF